jgi:hypothetical protein
MYYFDTSFLTPLIREEETSSRVARFIAGLPAVELAISRCADGSDPRRAGAGGGGVV